MKGYLFLVFLLVPLFAFGSGKYSAKEWDARVAQLLKTMTLEEKVGQMTQVSLEVIAKTEKGRTVEPLVVDPEKLREAVLKYHVGSILNVGTSAHTPDQWHKIITDIQDAATKETRLKIPVLYGIDAIHGGTYLAGATIFPQPWAMAATWNLDLMKRDGEITAVETRACGIPWNFNPNLDIGRQPLWPRLWETFGEDPYLASAMGRVYVEGQEGEDHNISSDDHVATCPKHYLGYSLPLTGKDRTPAWIPENMLREYAVPTFKAAVEAGASTVMANSSSINGMPVHASYYYLTELLRNQLGFKGMVVSDWADIINLYTRERVAATPKDAVRIAVMAGIDMSMVPLDYSFYDHLIKLVREKSVPMKRIDEAVGRILRVKFALGLFDNAYPKPELKARFATPEHAAVNLEAAREAITLLKNDKDLLPLAKKSRVLVTGPNANRLSVMNGGWTITWQGDREDLYPKDQLTVLRAIEEKIGSDNVTYIPGVSHDKEIDIAAAVAAAENVDAVIACLGEEAYCETPGNITDLNLPQAQLQLVQALQATGKPVVLVLLEGRPRIIRPIVEKTRGILMAYLPGMEGGKAIADVLFGDYNPCGKLPVTYPQHPNDLTLYDHTYAENCNPFCSYLPQWPFGFGLSYTVFKYSDLKLDKTTITSGESVKASVTVTNIGRLAGKEVVQLYLSDLVASLTPAEKRLKGFFKVALQPGESKTISLTLTPQDMSCYNFSGKKVLEPGEFKVTIGSLQELFTVN